MTTPIFNQRIIKFAKHLLTIQNHPRQGEVKVMSFCSIINSSCRFEYEVAIPVWVVEELFKVFPELKSQPFESAPEELLFDWFSMSDIEFINCLDVSGNYTLDCQRFGGRKLNEQSGPKELAANLNDLAAYRLSQLRYN